MEICANVCWFSEVKVYRLCALDVLRTWSFIPPEPVSLFENKCCSPLSCVGELFEITTGHVGPDGLYLTSDLFSSFFWLINLNILQNPGVVDHDLTCISLLTCDLHISSWWCLTIAAPWHFCIKQEACLDPIVCEPMDGGLQLWKLWAHRADCNALSLRQGLHPLTLYLWNHTTALLHLDCVSTNIDFLLNNEPVKRFNWTNSCLTWLFCDYCNIVCMWWNHCDIIPFTILQMEMFKCIKHRIVSVPTQMWKW